MYNNSFNILFIIYIKIYCLYRDFFLITHSICNIDQLLGNIITFFMWVVRGLFLKRNSREATRNIQAIEPLCGKFFLLLCSYLFLLVYCVYFCKFQIEVCKLRSNIPLHFQKGFENRYQCE